MAIECPPVETLERYASGALLGDEADTVDTHVGCCPSCLDRLNRMDPPADAVLAALRKLPDAAPRVTPSVAQAVAAAVAAAKPVPGLSAGDVVGGYRIVEELGRGGMGRVYRAAHPRLDQDVALKVLRPGLDSGPILARFEAERQTLARMDHPNIARVFDGGATAGGQPYFAMEMIRGTPITRYCDDHAAPVHRRLELFAEVCRAVQHAHQKGVIHRDLKPSNILVAEFDGRPTVKVIDFGVAKAIDRVSPAETEVGMLVGTPEYMSPEQATLSGSDVDTRTDVYALGVVLYELLTGDTPFERARLRSAGVLEVLRIVREEEPPPPSTRLVGAAGRQVYGDLDWITLKALEKDRSRRYDSAAAVADDVVRYLTDQPVEAGRPGRAYRLRKFVRRNQTAVVAAGLVLAALIAGMVGTTLGLLKANRERDDKQAALTAETAARDLAFQSLLALTDDVVERQMSRRETLTKDDRAFLMRIVGQFNAFADLRQDSEEGRRIRALGTGKIALIWATLGEHVQALNLLEQLLTQWEGLARDYPGQPMYRLEIGKTLGNVGYQYRRQGRDGDAEAAFDRARSILLGLTAEDPTDAGYRLELARIHVNYREYYERKGKYREAETEVLKAIDLFRGLSEEFPSDALYRATLAQSHQSLAMLLSTVNEPERSEASYRIALGIFSQLAAEDPDTPEYRKMVAITNVNLGNLLRAGKKVEAAQAEYRKALGVFQALVAEYPALAEHRKNLSSCHNSLGSALLDAGKRADAEAEYTKAITLRKQLAAEFPTRSEYRQLLGNTYNNLANVQKLDKRYRDAEEGYRQALTLAQRLAADAPTVPEYAVEYGMYCGNFGVLLTDTDRPGDALDWHAKAIGALSPVVAAEPRHTSATRFLRNNHRGRANAFVKLKRYADAIPDVDRALALDDGTNRAAFLSLRAACLARTDPAKAVLDVRELVKGKGLTSTVVYNAACVLSVASAGLTDPAEQDRVGREAVQYLRQLSAKDYFKTPANLDRLLSDPDFDPIRTRDDFKQAVSEIVPDPSKNGKR